MADDDEGQLEEGAEVEPPPPEPEEPPAGTEAGEAPAGQEGQAQIGPNVADDDEGQLEEGAEVEPPPPDAEPPDEPEGPPAAAKPIEARAGTNEKTPEHAPAAPSPLMNPLVEEAVRQAVSTSVKAAVEAAFAGVPKPKVDDPAGWWKKAPVASAIVTAGFGALVSALTLIYSDLAQERDLALLKAKQTSEIEMAQLEFEHKRQAWYFKYAIDPGTTAELRARVLNFLRRDCGRLDGLRECEDDKYEDCDPRVVEWAEEEYSEATKLVFSFYEAQSQLDEAERKLAAYEMKLESLGPDASSEVLEQKISDAKLEVLRLRQEAETLRSTAAGSTFAPRRVTKRRRRASEPSETSDPSEPPDPSEPISSEIWPSTGLGGGSESAIGLGCLEGTCVEESYFVEQSCRGLLPCTILQLSCSGLFECHVRG